MEETGLKVKGVKLMNVTNDVFTDLGKHYITLYVICEMSDPEAQPQVSHDGQVLSDRLAEHACACRVDI